MELINHYEIVRGRREEAKRHLKLRQWAGDRAVQHWMMSEHSGYFFDFYWRNGESKPVPYGCEVRDEDDDWGVLGYGRVEMCWDVYENSQGHLDATEAFYVSARLAFVIGTHDPRRLPIAPSIVIERENGLFEATFILDEAIGEGESRRYGERLAQAAGNVSFKSRGIVAGSALGSGGFARLVTLEKALTTKKMIRSL